MEHNWNKWSFLQRHADGASGDAGSGTAVGGNTQAVNADIAGQSANGQNGGIARPTFDEILKDADYNAAYEKMVGERVNKAIQTRFKTANATEERLKKTSPLVEKMALKYGIEVGADGTYDLDAIVKAADDDDSYYEAEALEKGISVADLKKIKSLERENAQFRAERENARKQEAEKQLYQSLMDGASKTKALYPQFDLDTEMKNESFARMVLRAGVPVQTAYEVTHRNEIMPAVMQFAANKTARQYAQTIAAGKGRPVENGTNAQRAVSTQLDPAHLTKEQRREIEERARRGEKIAF